MSKKPRSALQKLILGPEIPSFIPDGVLKSLEQMSSLHPDLSRFGEPYSFIKEIYKPLDQIFEEAEHSRALPDKPLLPIPRNGSIEAERVAGFCRAATKQGLTEKALKLKAMEHFKPSTFTDRVWRDAFRAYRFKRSPGDHSNTVKKYRKS